MRPHIKELIMRQQDTYKNVFLKHAKAFHTPKFHYDWWMFPVPVPPGANVSPTTQYYAVNQQDTLDLLTHNSFISTYLDSLHRYLGNLQNHGWDNYPIRYAKMLLSVANFIKVASGLVKDKNISVIHESLINFAKAAVAYADHNHLQGSHPLLDSGLSKLAKLLPTPKKNNYRLK